MFQSEVMWYTNKPATWAHLKPELSLLFNLFLFTEDTENIMKLAEDDSLQLIIDFVMPWNLL